MEERGQERGRKGEKYEAERVVRRKRERSIGITRNTLKLLYIVHVLIIKIALIMRCG